MRTLSGMPELEAAVGTHLGHSPWHAVSQQQIDLFAEATGDHQWIHVDEARANGGPFGKTVAHGFLTLSLLPKLHGEVFTIEGVTALLNYGADRLRFPAPVLVDSRVRVGVEVVELAPHAVGRILRMRSVIEIDGESKPACIAETLAMVVA